MRLSASMAPSQTKAAAGFAEEDMPQKQSGPVRRIPWKGIDWKVFDLCG